MPEAQTAIPGALQMTDAELTQERERSRSVGMISVITVAMFSAFVVCQYFALKDAAGGDAALTLKSIENNKLIYILSGFFFSVATLFVAVALTHILFAARSRTTRIAKLPFYMAIAGPVLVALAYPVYTIGYVSAANDFAASAHGGLELAKDLSGSTLITIASGAWRLGQAMLVVAWVATGIYAMRIGLLTRMMGAFAIAIGVATLIAPPLAALLQVFWIGALAILLLGESAQIPPAWKLGRPVSWSEVDAMRRQVAGDEELESFNRSDQSAD